MFIRGIKELFDHVIRASLLKKHASTERSRHELLLATWDLKTTRRSIHTLEQIQHHFKSVHTLSELELQFWLNMYTDCGLPELKEDELFYGTWFSSLVQEANWDATKLTLMVEHVREHHLDIDSNGETSVVDDRNKPTDLMVALVREQGLNGTPFNGELVDEEGASCIE